MTALKPIENRRVRGVPSERYPLNKVCAHPECTDAAVDPHHVFPRSAIGNDSWFVEIVYPADMPFTEMKELMGHAFVRASGAEFMSTIIPHVAGLCRAHHDDAEEHRAWIKLVDGEFFWYERHSPQRMSADYAEDGWDQVGPLNPQPGSREGKTKRKKRKKGAERASRATWTIRVPDRDADEPLLEDLVERLEELIQADAGEHAASPRSPYYTLVDAVNYTLLNEYPGSEE